MIRYALSCSDGHRFEAWFRSAEDFDAQKARRLLSCPTCGESTVEKALMAPAVVGVRDPAPVPVAATQETPAEPSVPAVAIPKEAAEMIGRLRALKKALIADSEDVGKGFAEEARKIHYGEAPARAVHGQATLEDARSLVEEGVEVMPLPILPEDRN